MNWFCFCDSCGDIARSVHNGGAVAFCSAVCRNVGVVGNGDVSDKPQLQFVNLRSVILQMLRLHRRGGCVVLRDAVGVTRNFRDVYDWWRKLRGRRTIYLRPRR